MQDLSEKVTVSKKDDLADKTFMQSITVSILGMVLCMVALCSMTWAWFSADISSNSNSIKSATCNLTILIGDVAISDDTFTFVKEKEYTVKMIAEGTANSAYCILKSDGNSYYTVQIPMSADEEQRAVLPNYIIFNLKFSNDTTVEFTKRWGRSSRDERELDDGRYYFNFEELDTSTGEEEKGE